MTAARPKFVGLKTCFPFQRSRNLLATASAAAATARDASFVRRSRHRDSPEMRALFGSKEGRRQIRVHAYCVARARSRGEAPRAPGVTSKESAAIP